MAFLTVEVPAPDEPVTAIIGCFPVITIPLVQLGYFPMPEQNITLLFRLGS
jgi:hypothetical protein